MSKGKKKKLYGGGTIQQYQTPQSMVQSGQQADAIGSAIGKVPVWGQMVQAGMKIGQGIGATTKDAKTGLYNNKAGQVLDNAINPTTHLQNFKDLSKDPSFSNIANQLSLGLIGKGATQKRLEEELKERQNIMKADTKFDLMANSALPAMKHGGKILASKLSPVQGGHLEAISDDAVEVKANNPSETDSVELPSAFVDDSEIIDTQQRVFSDELLSRTGRTFAKEAKRLNKMKREDYETRFAKANSHIDGKLDALFNEQESMKTTNSKNKMQLGGVIEPGKPMAKGPEYKFNPNSSLLQQQLNAKLNLSEAVRFKNRVINNTVVPIEGPNVIQDRNVNQYVTVDPSAIQKADSTILASRKFLNAKKKLAPGGTIPPVGEYDLQNHLIQSQIMVPEKLGRPNITVPPTTSSASTDNTSGFNWSQVGQGALALAPNIANVALQRKLKGPVAAKMENTVKLNKFSAEPQLTGIDQATSAAQTALINNTAQSGNLASATGNLLAKKLSARNQVYGDINAINNQVQNQETTLNLGVKQRNIDRTAGYQNNKVDFFNKKLQMTSENIANASAKLQVMNKERNMMNLDRDKYAILMASYNDLPAEMKARYPTLFDYMNRDKVKQASGGYYGGKLNRKKK